MFVTKILAEKKLKTKFKFHQFYILPNNYLRPIHHDLKKGELNIFIKSIFDY